MTRTISDEPKVIDDSRKHPQPMELIIGKKFKFETWEECLHTMTKNEISSFIVDKKVCLVMFGGRVAEMTLHLLVSRFTIYTAALV